MIKLTRVPDWNANLTNTILDWQDKPFAWGEHDCCLFAGDCVLAVTGTDLIENIRGSYNTVEGAFKTIKKVYKADNVADLFSSRFEEVHISSVRIGDIVFQHSNMLGFNLRIGVCYGEHSFFLEENGGLVKVRTIEFDGGFWIG